MSTNTVTLFYQDRINRTLLSSLDWQAEHLQSKVEHFFASDESPRELLLRYADADRYVRWSSYEVDSFVAAAGYAAILAKRDNPKWLLVEFSPEDVFETDILDCYEMVMRNSLNVVFCCWTREEDHERMSQFFTDAYVLQKDDPVAVEILFDKIKPRDVLFMPDTGADDTSRLLWFESVKLRYERALESLCNSPQI